MQVLSPQLLGVFIDGAMRGAALRGLLIIAAAFVAASLVQQGLLVGAAYMSERVAWTATNALRADLAAHALSLDPACHAEHTPGELIERIDGDVTAIASFLSQFVIQVVGNVLLLLGILLMLWTFDVRVGLVLSVFAVLALAIMLGTRAVAVPYWVTFREASAGLFGFLEERLVAWRTWFRSAPDSTCSTSLANTPASACGRHAGPACCRASRGPCRSSCRELVSR